MCYTDLRWSQQFWPFSNHNLVRSPPLECGLTQRFSFNERKAEWWVFCSKMKLQRDSGFCLACLSLFFSYLLSRKLAAMFALPNGETQVEKTTMSPTTSQQRPETTATLVSLEGNPCPAQPWETAAPVYILVKTLLRHSEPRTQLNCNKISNP